MDLQDVGPGAGEHPGDAGDLAGARQEAQDVPVALGRGPPDGRGDVREEGRVDAHAVGRRDGARRRRPDRLDRVQRRLGLHDGRAAEEPRPGPGVGGGGRGDQPQVGADRGAHVQQERQRGVGVQVPLVALVQDHRADAGEVGFGLEPLQDDARGDDLDAGAGTGLAAHGDADPATDALAEQPGHAAGGGAGGEAPRFQHEHLPGGGRAAEGEPGEGERDQGRLAGAGRRGQHRRAAAVQGRAQGGDGVADGEGLGGAQLHRPSVPPRRAGPGTAPDELRRKRLCFLR
ncbi:hypothetical protein LUX39_10130 [Actinomadura madurae]|nr:hypothetical protein [Actinomadura madurae]MCQ0014083.1 hypothetical protein [Actinomadura madurae]